MRTWLYFYTYVGHGERTESVSEGHSFILSLQVSFHKLLDECPVNFACVEFWSKLKFGNVKFFKPVPVAEMSEALVFIALTL
jgi:hypothetical protein